MKQMFEKGDWEARIMKSPSGPFIALSYDGKFFCAVNSIEAKSFLPDLAAVIAEAQKMIKETEGGP